MAADFRLLQSGSDLQKDLNLIEQAIAPEYNPTVIYNIGDRVTYNGALYVCLENNVTST